MPIKAWLDKKIPQSGFEFLSGSRWRVWMGDPL